MRDATSRSSVTLSRSDRFQIGASLLPPIALLWIASRRGWIPVPPGIFLAAMPGAVVLGMLFPTAFLGWHRTFSRIQRWVGARVLALLLGVVFLLTLLPIGLWLRARGRSFLEPESSETYWVPVRPPGSLKNQY